MSASDEAGAALDKLSGIGPQTPDAPLSTIYTRYVVGLLAVVYVFNYMDRTALSVFMPAIKAELSLSDSQLGLLVGLPFALFYAVCGIPVARLADRTNRRNIIAAALGVWSLMTALTGAAQSYALLILARMGVGAGESGCAPPSQSIICDYVRYGERPGALAMLSVGAVVGVMAGLMLGGILADAVGWRWAFVILGVPGIALAFIVLFTLREPVRGRLDAAVERGRALSLRQAFASLVGSRTYLLLSGYIVANAFLQFGVGAWQASFYDRSFGLPMSSIGTSLAIASGIGACVGLLLGATLANRAAKRKARGASPFMIGALILAGPAMVGALFVPSAIASLSLVAVGGVLLNIPVGTIAAAVNSVVPAAARATAASLTAFAVAAIGLSLGPLSVGVLSDWLTPQLGAEALRYALLAPLVMFPIMIALFVLGSNTLAKDLKTAGVQV